MNTGHIVKSKLNTSFTAIANEFARNPNISLKAKGLFLQLISLPDDWAVVKKQLPSFSKDGYDSVDSAFKELESLGYIVGVQVFNSGKFAGWNYVIYQEPVPEQARTRMPDGKRLPNRDFPETVFPKTEIPYLQKKEYTKKDYTKKYDSLTPTANDVVAYFESIGESREEALLFHDKYTALGWKDPNGLRIENWQAYARASWQPNIKVMTQRRTAKKEKKVSAPEVRKLVI